jgi:hypothetical protein
MMAQTCLSVAEAGIHALQFSTYERGVAIASGEA